MSGTQRRQAIVDPPLRGNARGIDPQRLAGHGRLILPAHEAGAKVEGEAAMGRVRQEVARHRRVEGRVHRDQARHGR